MIRRTVSGRLGSFAVTTAARTPRTARTVRGEEPPTPAGNGLPVQSKRPPLHTMGMAALGLTLLVWSFGPTLSAKVGTHPIVSTFVRMTGAGIIQWVIVLVMKIPPSKAMLRRAMLPGALFCLNNVLFFLSLQHASVANATLLVSLQPVVVLFVAKPLFDEEIRVWQVICTLIALGGAAIAVLGGNSAKTHPTSALGAVAALSAMVTFCGYFLISKKANSIPGEAPPNPLTYLTAVITSSAITSIPFLLVSGHSSQVVHLTATQAKALALVVVIPTLGHLSLMYTHRHINASLSSLVLLLQPVSSALIAWWLLDQRIAGVQVLGAAIVLASIDPRVEP
jgi:drug/metabolite transporter (DMT)-like permease